jgi:hypothetical protein
MPETTTPIDVTGLRTSHQVRLIDGDKEGFAADHQPNGVYGFTYAPQEAAIPMFTRQSWHSFEIHKLPDGALHLVGYVTAADAGFIRSGQHVEVTLFPDPFEDATGLVSVPMTRIVPSKRGPSRDGGNGLKIELL